MRHLLDFPHRAGNIVEGQPLGKGLERHQMNVGRLGAGPVEDVADVFFKMLQGEVAEILRGPILKMVYDHQVLLLCGWGISRNVV